jgi:two-component system chemotaxis sensor kinase CheA
LKPVKTVTKAGATAAAPKPRAQKKTAAVSDEVSEVLELAIAQEEEAPLSAEELAAGKDELSSAVEDLALQVMVKGIDAFSTKTLKQLIEMGDRFQCPDVANEARSAAKRLEEKLLTEDDAKSLVSQMQSLMTVPAVQEKKVDDKPAAVDTTSVLAFEEDPELLADFVMESEEHLASIEEKILILEKDPSLIDTIHAVFRSFHSIKGLAGFLGLSGVQTVAHEVETLLDHARNLRISVNSDVVDLVLESSEYLKEEVAVVQAKLNNAPLPPVRDNTALIKTLSTATATVAAGGTISLGAGAKAEHTVAAPSTPAPSAPAPQPEIEDEPEVIDEEMVEDEPAVEPVAAAPKTTPAPAAAAVAPPTAQAPPVQKAAVAAPAPAAEVLPPAEVRPAAPVAPATARTEAASTSIRVETSKLDRLMDMVGEMVIAQSILSNIPRTGSSGDARVAGEMSQLARITSEVQRCAMSMRMMPVGPLFQKNAKMVRDLSRRNGKQVNLELAGENTEVDKTIAEELSDPLLHMIRNSMDHGIEEPNERIAAGKSLVASVRIAAEHQAGQIVISISDDGRGLDPQRIRNKAIQNGLIEPNAQLTEAEIFHLIFAPGFSTAEKITDISGRGVGMDVVRQHVESLRGRIEIKSELGKGTTFFILLPLTLAIIEGLVIVVGEHRYIIPLFSVREMFRPTQEMLFTVQGSDEMILMRGALLPLVRLHKRFAITPRTDNICEGLLVVCEFAGKLFCLFVDDLLGRQEVVIKSLDEAFKNVKGLTGSAILGDGRIGLILDVAGIFNSQPPGQELLSA